MIAPYGSWPSPITAESLTEGTVGIDEPQFDGEELYWLQSDPTDDGRVALWRRAAEGTDSRLTPAPFNVRTRVHEYGGGSYVAADGIVVFTNFTDNLLYRTDRDAGTARPVTEDSALRYAALQLHPEQDLLIAVREDHRGSGEPVNTIIARRLSDDPQVPDRVLCGGADFYASPQLSGDGRLAWIEWDHPNMPWDTTRLMVAELGALSETDHDRPLLTGHLLAGGDEESVAVPRWHPDGSLIFVSDRSDWWNLYRLRFGGEDDHPEPLHPTEAEFTDPPWTLGLQPYVIIDADRIVCSWNQRNRHQLGILYLSSGELEVIGTDAVSFSRIAATATTVATRMGYPDRSAELVTVDLTDRRTQVLRRSSVTAPPTELISTAVEVSWPVDDCTVHGWYYPPRNGDWTGPGDELPPMITVSHGGPTGGSSPDFRKSIAFWTSRGIAVLDVNYRGSTGYGRAFRNRLRGAWGEVDVADCAAGATAMVQQGRADGSRLAIQGGSAGGYTTLRALTATDRFTAGVSLFGIGDLTALATDTHKFESRYLDLLVGPYPEQADLYRDRSPIHHVDQLDAPILLLQGTEDKVVPPNQAETFAAAARAKQLPVALIMYEGEGHGFRRAVNIINAQQATLSFLGRVFGFEPADDLPPITIENL